MLLTKKFVFVSIVIFDLLICAEYQHYRATMLDIICFKGAFDMHM